MTTSGASLVGQYVTSSCSKTKEEHEYLVEKLLILCEKDRNCVSDNLRRMQELCSIAQENNIAKFHYKCKQYKNKYEVFDNMMVNLISETIPNLPHWRIKDKYRRSQNAYDVIQNLKKKQEWEASVTIQNKSDFPGFGTNVKFYLEYYPSHDDANWVLHLQVLEFEDDPDDEDTVLYHFKKKYMVFKKNGIHLSTIVKKIIRLIFENKFKPEDEPDDDSTSIRIGELTFKTDTV